MVYDSDDVARFHRHIDKTGDCWLWLKAKDKNGYGFFKLARKMIKAHRFMWQLLHGPIDRSLQVCHHCDNPPCVNPDHLFVGTCQDNRDDQTRKGRNLTGTRNPAAKLTDDDVREIRFLYDSGWTQQTIADAYGVAQAHISQICLGRCWHGV